MTLYQRLMQAGESVEGRYSDLHVEATESAREIVEEYALVQHGEYRDQIDGLLWIEVPFAFDPYWEANKNNPFAINPNTNA